MNEEDKIFYCPGDIVTIKHDIPNKPIMIVIKKEVMHIVPKSETNFKGIRCQWFTKNQELQEAVFNTKDLVKVS